MIHNGLSKRCKVRPQHMERTDDPWGAEMEGFEFGYGKDIEDKKSNHIIGLLGSVVRCHKY